MVQQGTRLETAAPRTTEPVRLTITYEEFQDLYTEGIRGEWVDGELIQFVAPKTIHLRVSRFLTIFLSDFVTDHRLGEILPTPELRPREGRSYCRPDIAFIAAANAGRISADGIAGPPDLVIEVVSDDSVQRDRKGTFDEYMASGVREY